MSRAIAGELGVTRVELSLSHTDEQAYAVAAAIKEDADMLESLLVGLYAAEQMRAVDTAAIEGLGIPGGHLMERAGAAVAREIVRRFEPDEP